MSDSPSEELQKFLFDFVEGVEDLHVLAWFRHRAADEVATTREVASATHIQETTVSEVLERLAARAVVEKEPGGVVAFRYTPPDPTFSAALDAVLDRYDASSIEVLQMLSANSIERVKLAALRTFAGGLRRRKPTDD